MHEGIDYVRRYAHMYILCLHVRMHMVTYVGLLGIVVSHEYVCAFRMCVDICACVYMNMV